MSAIAAIHVARKQLGLDEDTYRAVAVRVTGKGSAKDMTEAERQQLLEEFRRRGFKKASTGSRKKLEGRYAAKLQALWISAWNLGLVEHREDSALLAFVKRQTGIEHVRFLHYPEDANKAIEALKGWMAREAGVDWSVDKFMPDYAREPGCKIARAQFAILHRIDPAFAEMNSLVHWLLVSRRDRPGTPAHIEDFHSEHWPAVMNALGEKIREAKSA